MPSSRILFSCPNPLLENRKRRVLSCREVYRGPAFWVTTDRVLEPSGVRVRRDIVRHTGSVVVMPLDESGSEPQILLVRQYRYTAKQYLWELCAGRIDKGENELTAAKRELLEETGYSAKQLEAHPAFLRQPGFRGGNHGHLSGAWPACGSGTAGRG